MAEPETGSTKRAPPAPRLSDIVELDPADLAELKRIYAQGPTPLPAKEHPVIALRRKFQNTRFTEQQLDKWFIFHKDVIEELTDEDTCMERVRHLQSISGEKDPESSLVYGTPREINKEPY
jgi:hypothetical protein